MAIRQDLGMTGFPHDLEWIFDILPACDSSSSDFDVHLLSAGHDQAPLGMVASEQFTSQLASVIWSFAAETWFK
jgi:hypothetical protein